LQRQVGRMSRYYDDLRNELAEQVGRARKAEEAQARLPERLDSIDREEKLRIAELHQKNSLRVHVRLLQLLLVQQPKLLVRALASAPKQVSAPLEMVWDPLTEALEAIPCGECSRPTFALELRGARLVCPTCAARPAVSSRRR
jgi:hypothetical protein